jgi:hypothetical protein
LDLKAKFESSSSYFSLTKRSLAEVNLGSTGGQPGVNLGSAWGQPGVNLGSTWGQPGFNLGSTWGQPGVSLGSTWGQPGVNLGQPGVNLHRPTSCAPRSDSRPSHAHPSELAPHRTSSALGHAASCAPRLPRVKRASAQWRHVAGSSATACSTARLRLSSAGSGQRHVGHLGAIPCAVACARSLARHASAPASAQMMWPLVHCSTRPAG